VVLLIIAFGGSRVREAIVAASPTAIIFVPDEAARAPSPQPRRSEAKAAPKPAPPVPRPTPPVPPLTNDALPFIPMSKSDLAASDIARLGSAAAPAADKATGAKTAGLGDTFTLFVSDARYLFPAAVGKHSMRLLCKTVSRPGRRRVYPASTASPQRIKIVPLDQAWVIEGKLSPTGVDIFSAGPPTRPAHA